MNNSRVKIITSTKDAGVGNPLSPSEWVVAFKSVLSATRTPANCVVSLCPLTANTKFQLIRTALSPLPHPFSCRRRADVKEEKGIFTIGSELCS